MIFARDQVKDIVLRVWPYIIIGVGLGAALSFMMAVTALSLPSLIMLKKVVKGPLLTLFFVIVTIGIMVIGYLFQILGPYIL